MAHVMSLPYKPLQNVSDVDMQQWLAEYALKSKKLEELRKDCELNKKIVKRKFEELVVGMGGRRWRRCWRRDGGRSGRAWRGGMGRKM